MSSVISHAGQMGLQSLVNEPSRLTAAAVAANEELEALVMDNYRVFIENLTCSVELRVEDARLNKVFSNLGGNLEELSGQCASFREKVSSFIGSHQRNRKTLQHHTQLVELLEVPQLVDACARNGFHDESLELANFVNGLEKKHLLAAGLKASRNEKEQDDKAQEIHRGGVVIQSIVNDVHAALLGLRGQLISQLSEESSLPKELQVLATLRKLDSLLLDRQLSLERHNNPVVEALSDEQRDSLRTYFLRSAETRLQMEFLEARTVWLQRAKGVGDALPLPAGDGSDFYGLSENDSAGPPSSSSSSSSSSSVKATRGHYSRAIELLDLHRSAWFSIVTEYTALFEGQQDPGDGEGGGGLDKAREQGSNPRDGGGFFGLGWEAVAKKRDMGEVAGSISGEGMPPEGPQQHAVAASTVLSAWMSTQLQALIAQLEHLCLGIDDGNELRAIIEQTVYFAERMGHVGFDFTAAVVPIFHSIVLSKVAMALSDAVEDFEGMLATERYQPDQRANLSGAEKGTMQQVVPLYAQPHQTQGLTARQDTSAQSTPQKSSAAARSDDGELPAPRDLSAFPPLAFLLNTILSQLAFLRECPLKAVKGGVAELLASLLCRVSEHLVKVRHALATRGARYLEVSQAKDGVDGEGESKSTMDVLYARAFAFDLAPHALACFDCIYGEGVVKALEVSSPAADPSRRDTGRGGVSVGGETVSAKVEKPQLQALHVERLLDAETVLSSDSYVCLRSAWARLSSEGMIVEKSLTPSPVPPATR